MDAETFAAWQSELNGFLAVTRNRLQSLSQSLSQCPPGQQPNSHDSCQIVTQSESAVSTPMNSGMASTIVNDCKPPAEQRTATSDDTPTNDDDSDSDPIERLNVIKRRLANQMRNVSRFA